MGSIEAKVKSSYYVRMVLLGLLTCGLGAAFFFFLQQSWLKTLDAEGCTLRSGKRLAWKDVQIKPIYVKGRTAQVAYLNRIEIGSGRVFPLMLENSAEVLEYLGRISGTKIPSSTWEG